MIIPPFKMTFTEALYHLGACFAARDYTRYKTFEEAWKTCPPSRPDWMMWLVEQMEGNEGWPNVKTIAKIATLSFAVKWENQTAFLLKELSVPYDYFLPPDPEHFKWDTLRYPHPVTNVHASEVHLPR